MRREFIRSGVAVRPVRSRRPGPQKQNTKGGVGMACGGSSNGRGNSADQSRDGRIHVASGPIHRA